MNNFIVSKKVYNCNLTLVNDKITTVKGIYAWGLQCRGSSVVERSPEEAGVGGPIPSRGTSVRLYAGPILFYTTNK
jgi:hypothetical protein